MSLGQGVPTQQPPKVPRAARLGAGSRWHWHDTDLPPCPQAGSSGDKQQGLDLEECGRRRMERKVSLSATRFGTAGTAS